MKLLLLDLDGTVREPKSGAKFINDPLDQKLINGVEEAIARYQDWTIVGVTNQGGVASGFKTLEDAIAEQRITLELCPQLDQILFCPDFEGNTGGRVVRVGESFYDFTVDRTGIEGIRGLRKPEPGMIDLAFEYYQSGAYSFARDKFGDNVRITQTLMVGDREEDQLAAQAAGVEFMWAETWRTSKVPF